MKKKILYEMTFNWSCSQTKGIPVRNLSNNIHVIEWHKDFTKPCITEQIYDHRMAYHMAAWIQLAQKYVPFFFQMQIKFFTILFLKSIRFTQLHERLTIIGAYLKIITHDHLNRSRTRGIMLKVCTA